MMFPEQEHYHWSIRSHSTGGPSGHHTDWLTTQAYIPADNNLTNLVHPEINEIWGEHIFFRVIAFFY